MSNEFLEEKKRMTVREELRQLAFANEMDYFGVSSPDRLSNLPEGHRPNDMLPTAATVIVLGMRISQGVLRAHEMAFSGNRIPMPVFTQFGFNKPSEFTNIAALKMLRLIEKKYKKITFPIPSGEPHDEFLFMGAMSNRYAALCAGLGEMTWSGFVATPKDGPRVKWVSLITELPLEPDPLYHGPRLCCPEECSICVDVCPAKALSRRESVKVVIGEFSTKYAKRNKALCRCATSGLIKGTPGRLQAEMPERMETMEDWFALRKKDNHWNKAEFHHGNYCLRCMTQCPIGRHTDHC
jgi:epoxyqueuosine reductase QueG